MTCETRIAEYAASHSRWQRVRHTLHRTVCPSCRTAFRDTERVERALASLQRQAPPDSAVERALAGTVGSRPIRPPAVLRFARLAAVGAVVVLVGLVFGLPRLNGERPRITVGGQALDMRLGTMHFVILTPAFPDMPAGTVEVWLAGDCYRQETTFPSAGGEASTAPGDKTEVVVFDGQREWEYKAGAHGDLLANVSLVSREEDEQACRQRPVILDTLHTEARVRAVAVPAVPVNTLRAQRDEPILVRVDSQCHTPVTLVGEGEPLQCDSAWLPDLLDRHIVGGGAQLPE